MRVAAPLLVVGSVSAIVTSCGGDTLGVATTVVPVQPTNFQTIPPVSSTLPGTTTTLPANALGQETLYTVVAGDTPSGVAAKYGISLSTLLAYNAWVTPSQFPYPGQTVRIPPQGVNPGTGTGTGTGIGTGTGTNTDPALTGCGVRPAGTYKVKSNDSVYKIRKSFCVSLASLLAANGWSDVGSVVLLVGDVINIPAAGS